MDIEHVVGLLEGVLDLLHDDEVFDGVVAGPSEALFLCSEESGDIFDEIEDLVLVNVVSEEENISDHVGGMEEIQVVEIEVLVSKGNILSKLQDHWPSGRCYSRLVQRLK